MANPPMADPRIRAMPRMANRARTTLEGSGRELADDLASSPAAMRMRLMRPPSSVYALARRARAGLVFAATLATAGVDDVLPIAGAAADLV